VYFTGSIRRKLLVGLGLVLFMLSILSIGGIVGLHSYRNVVRNLEYDISEAPHQPEVVAAVAGLFEPLRLPVRDASGAAYQQRLFEQRLDAVDKALAEFHRRIDEMPLSKLPAGQRPVIEACLANIAQRLKHIRADQRHLAVEEQRANVVAFLLTDVADLQTVVRQIPDPVEGMIGTLDHAKKVYRSSLITVWGATALVLLLLAGLIRNGYVWIFEPIREMHRGAVRVANGDFDYRVRLRTRDEMADLAEAFNRMTARFQEIAGDLDRQVQERSRQLVRSERLAGVGFLAAGVAHEINNPLSAIAMAAESLESRAADVLSRLEPADAAIIKQYLQMIQNESFRCKEITERLLDFSRGRESTREPTDLTRLVSEVIAMVQYLGKFREKKIDFTHAAPCYAEVSGPEIKQVVLNLVANGLDAMQPGGTLSIELIEQTDHVTLSFRDEGCGMTPEVIEHMFEPFFTSKQPGQGTGLGLSISHRIITQHGGTISASSAGPGQGSTFSIRLPRKPPRQTAAA
jgi:two-component system, NtrC family, sensor kinase